MKSFSLEYYFSDIFTSINLQAIKILLSHSRLKVERFIIMIHCILNEKVNIFREVNEVLLLFFCQMSVPKFNDNHSLNFSRYVFITKSIIRVAK